MNDKFVCPFCEMETIKREGPVHSHLLKHENSGEIDRQDIYEVKDIVFGKFEGKRDRMKMENRAL